MTEQNKQFSKNKKPTLQEYWRNEEEERLKLISLNLARDLRGLLAGFWRKAPLDIIKIVVDYHTRTEWQIAQMYKFHW